MVDLSEDQKAMVAAQDALRSGRHLLRTMTTQLLSTEAIPPRSPLAQILKEMEEAERQLRDAILRSLR